MPEDVLFTSLGHTRLSGAAETEFESGRFKDLRRHAFFEAATTAPFSVRTPLLPLRQSSGDGQHRLKAV